MPDDTTPRTIRVWDLPTRLFHWTLVLLLIFQVVTGKMAGEWLRWHFWAGYAILTLLIFRIVWGIIGSTTARFSDFVRGPMAGVAHLKELLGPHAPKDVGHNPVGGWMVVALILALFVQAGSGLFTTDDILVDGPLVAKASEGWVKAMTSLHKLWINLLFLMVALHVAAALVYLVVKKQNLIAAMITGRKPWPFADTPKLRFVGSGVALSCLVAAAALVYLALRVAG